MREVVLAGIRKMLGILAIITAMLVVSLLAYDQGVLIFGLAAGYLMGTAWYGVMLGRLWRSADMTVARAKSTMASGLIIRLLLLAAVFGAAIHVSMAQFVAVVTGFAVVYVLGLLLLIHTNYSKYL
ncbi:MAG: hypothetical protein K6C05_04895 [Anaerovibrio sp.]|uniref:hypothetical protein n=1 Tax=Anaerovibrio sp. TaxID=1872532 RepID=UPI0025F55924|nr:hypothetical protein [Anaerovibrio sp.]MCR5176167.1 hypothetical protein [Anaerovibrio sp.]